MEKGNLWDPLSLPGVPKRTPNFTQRSPVLLPEVGRDSVTTALQHFRVEGKTLLWDVQRMLGAKLQLQKTAQDCTEAEKQASVPGAVDGCWAPPHAPLKAHGPLNPKCYIGGGGIMFLAA